MADAIPAPVPVATTPTSAGGNGPVTVVADQGTTATPLSNGDLVEAAVQARLPKGALELVTTTGDTIQIKAPPGTTLPPVATGASVLLQVINQGSDIRLQLLAVNGRVLAGALMQGNADALGLLAQTGNRGASAPTGTTNTPGSPVLPTPTGVATPPPLGMIATLIRPAFSPGVRLPSPGMPQSGTAPPEGPTAGSIPPGLAADLPAGTRLTVRIVTVGPEMPGTAGQPGLTNAPTTTGPAIPQPAPGGATGAFPPAPGRGEALAGSMAPQPSPQAPATLSPRQPTLLAGMVTSHPPGGNALVQTAIGLLSVPAQADLPAGTRLLLDMVGEPLPPLPATTAAPAPSGLGAQGWPALAEALDTLAGANQSQALQQLLRVLPQADTRLAASLAAFAGGLQRAETKSLLPESSLRDLEKIGRKELAAKLRGDLETLGEEAGRPVAGGDWRSYTLPFLNGQVVEPIRLFVRHRGDDDSAGTRGAKGDDQRFVVDISLSRLGRLQLDGLVRRADKLFDLIIRTDQPLSADMRRDILGIFAEAGELIGTKGMVSFQAGGRWMEFPPTPPPTRLEV